MIGLYTNMPSLSKLNPQSGEIEKKPWRFAADSSCSDLIKTNAELKKLYEKCRPATIGISGTKQAVAYVFLDKHLFQALLW